MGGVSWNCSKCEYELVITPSPPLWVAWVEISMSDLIDRLSVRRHPYGWRELKCLLIIVPDAREVSWNQTRKTATIPIAMSPPLWVAWVEMLSSENRIQIYHRRRPYGWRELKCTSFVDWINSDGCRRPYGWRELKWLVNPYLCNASNTSPPLWVAWVEI